MQSLCMLNRLAGYVHMYLSWSLENEGRKTTHPPLFFAPVAKYLGHLPRNTETLGAFMGMIWEVEGGELQLAWIQKLC